jgi:hypothetical protein
MDISKSSLHYKFYSSLNDAPEDPSLGDYWATIIAVLLVLATAVCGAMFGSLMIWEAFNSSEPLHPVHASNKATSGVAMVGLSLWGLQITTGLFTRIGRGIKAALRWDDATTFTD